MTHPQDFGQKFTPIRRFLSLENSPILTLYNVCAVPWGVRSTVGVFSTVGDIMSTVGRYLEYHGVFSTMGDIMINVGDILSTVGVFSTVGGYHEYRGGYLEYCGGCSVPWDPGYHDACGGIS